MKLPFVCNFEFSKLPTFQFSSSNYNVVESVGTATVTVTLSIAWPVTVTVAYATSDGTATARPAATTPLSEAV